MFISLEVLVSSKSGSAMYTRQDIPKVVAQAFIYYMSTNHSTQQTFRALNPNCSDFMTSSPCLSLFSYTRFASRSGISILFTFSECTSAVPRRFPFNRRSLGRQWSFYLERTLSFETKRVLWLWSILQDIPESESTLQRAVLHSKRAYNLHQLYIQHG